MRTLITDSDLNPDPELAPAWMRQGVAAYLRKPFEPTYLIELCAEARRVLALLRMENLLEERTLQLFFFLTNGSCRLYYLINPTGMVGFKFLLGTGYRF